MRWHWQSLNEDDRHLRGKRFPWHGRAWFYWGEREAFRVEWHLRSRSAAISFERDPGDALAQVWLALPPVSLFIGWPIRFGRGPTREWSLRVFDSSVWWRFGEDPNGWDSRRPRWRDGCWHVLDTLLGRSKYSKVDGERRSIVIPMPEGVYPAMAMFETCTWKRPRWFAKVRHFTAINIDRAGGIPHEGKGENSWDCGTDGLCGYSTEGHDLAAAIGDGVARMLRYRRQYDGNMLAKYPPPSAPSPAASRDSTPPHPVSGPPVAPDPNSSNEEGT